MPLFSNFEKCWRLAGFQAVYNHSKLAWGNCIMLFWGLSLRNV